ncbi:phosphatidylserine decarboxylase [Ponticaulis sp.]|uniref:phosphatidylserine decarboxylase n=1 Tax=Ponticaulis sp. TaxID=2020902 RepID=UPI0025E309EC|nr:phosphatidylserine decarboxylase [Ponticaulis sp.]
MAKKSLSNSMPWFRAEFDLEGLGFGGLALVLAIILGGLHWILGLIFLIVFGIILLASRDAERTPPNGDDLVLAPCDGVVESVSSVAPPRELRWDTPEVTRIRISSSPFSVNGVRASMTGNVESFLVEPGAPATLSTDPDNPNLREAFILISSEDHAVGLRIATGGTGPRLDIDLEPGDGVRAGRKIGVRRLGGWSDIYLPVGAETALETGMTVVGGETILTALAGVEKSATVASEYVPEPVVEEEVVLAPAPVAPEAEAEPVAVETPEPNATETTDDVIVTEADPADDADKK